ncbi:hypothetical protein ABZ942_16415 [Nocardia sp. NPDC046473]
MSDMVLALGSAAIPGRAFGSARDGGKWAVRNPHYETLPGAAVVSDRS